MKALKLKNVLPLILISLLLINCSKSCQNKDENNVPIGSKLMQPNSEKNNNYANTSKKKLVFIS